MLASWAPAPSSCRAAAAVAQGGARWSPCASRAGRSMAAAAAAGQAAVPVARPRAPCRLVVVAARKTAGSSGDSGGSSGAGSKSGTTKAAAPARMKGRCVASPVPDIDAQQLLRSLGLDGAAQPAALLASLRKLRYGVRQQGVLDNAGAVTTHLLSPAVGLTQQQAGQLLECCPELFSWPPQQRAAVLFAQLLEAGLAAAEAARCFETCPQAAQVRSFAGLAELTAILERSGDPQRTAAALLRTKPLAIVLVCSSAGSLQQHAAQLQGEGFTAADVAGLAWVGPLLLARDAAGSLATCALVLREELGLPTAEGVSLIASSKPRWLTCSADTLRMRARQLAKVFGRDAAATFLRRNVQAMSCAPEVYQRNLRFMAACGVADPSAVLLRAPRLLPCDHAAPAFVQRRLLLQRSFQLTADQLYQKHAWSLVNGQAPLLAQRLQFIEHCGQQRRLAMQGLPEAESHPLLITGQLPDHFRLSMSVVLRHKQPALLAAVGATDAEWAAFAAANPPEECATFRWAQQEAAQEVQRLLAALPAELAAWQPKPSIFDRRRA